MVAAYVSQSITSAPYRYQARILVHAPAEAVARRSSPAAVRLETAGPDACILHTGSNSLDELALHVALKGFDFQVLDPPELIPSCAACPGAWAGPPTRPRTRSRPRERLGRGQV